MKRYLKRFLSRVFNFAASDVLDEKIAHAREGLNQRISQTEKNIVKEVAKSEESILNKMNRGVNILETEFDKTFYLRRELVRVRQTKEYKDIFKKKDPLMTVRIATYNNAKQLVDVAVRSILKQTYQNFEIIIVGDGCTDDTEEKLKSINDPRIRFFNLPFRTVYPKDKRKRWLVAGSPGMNFGAEMARGDWIAPLDDDDEFTPDHIERLLMLAKQGRYEMVYGKLILRDLNSGKEKEIWSYPPEVNKFSFQGAMYMKLLSFFEYNTKSYLTDEPGDWNLCRRMMEAGVLIGLTDEVVGKMYHVPLEDKK